MHPILFNAGPVTIYSYGVLLASAYLLGLWLAVKRAKAAGVDPTRIMDLLIWVIISALVGAKALLFIVDFEHFTSSWQEFTTLLRSGGVFYGGLIAAIFVCIWQLRKHRLPLWSSGDLFAPGIALGYMVGRLGCLMAGCCCSSGARVISPAVLSGVSRCCMACCASSSSSSAATPAAATFLRCCRRRSSS